MLNTIKFYKIKDPHGYMSNFYRSRFFLDSNWWESTEHYYQAMKTLNQSERDQVRLAKTPKEARDLGQKVTMHPNFDLIKYDVMKSCVLAKFLQNQLLLQQLLATGDDFLIEASDVDYYWGCGADGSGKNMLGRVLMEIRTELRNG